MSSTPRLEATSVHVGVGTGLVTVWADQASGKVRLTAVDGFTDAEASVFMDAAGARDISEILAAAAESLGGAS